VKKGVKGGGTAFGGGRSKPPVTVCLSLVNSGCRHCFGHSTCSSTPLKNMPSLNPSSSSSSSTLCTCLLLYTPVGPLFFYYSFGFLFLGHLSMYTLLPKTKATFGRPKEISLSLLFMVPSSLVQFVRLLCRTCTSMRKKVDLMGPLKYHTTLDFLCFLGLISFFEFKLLLFFFLQMAMEGVDGGT